MLIEALQKQSGVSVSRLEWFAGTASRRYKVYRIRKKTRGARRIEHPSRELKSMQRWVNKYLFRSLPIHKNATAYKKGASIRQNAQKHANSSFTLRMDFQDFFPSFSQEAIAQFLRAKNTEQGLNLSDRDISFVTSIATRHGHLTVGSPSSPVITNVMMYDFDQIVTALTQPNSLIYSRYADDIFVSAKNGNELEGIEARIEDLARTYEHVSLRINRKKTAYLSRKYRRAITGLVITPDFRVSIGRDRKRKIRSQIHKFSIDRLRPLEVDELRGLLAFSLDAEPIFFKSLQRKYGEALLDRILRRKG